MGCRIRVTIPDPTRGAHMTMMAPGVHPMSRHRPVIGPALPRHGEPGFSVFAAPGLAVGPAGGRAAALVRLALAVGVLGTALWRPTELSIGYLVVGALVFGVVYGTAERRPTRRIARHRHDPGAAGGPGGAGRAVAERVVHRGCLAARLAHAGRRPHLDRDARRPVRGVGAARPCHRLGAARGAAGPLRSPRRWAASRWSPRSPALGVGVRRACSPEPTRRSTAGAEPDPVVRYRGHRLAQVVFFVVLRS